MGAGSLRSAADARRAKGPYRRAFAGTVLSFLGAAVLAGCGGERVSAPSATPVPTGNDRPPLTAVNVANGLGADGQYSTDGAKVNIDDGKAYVVANGSVQFGKDVRNANVAIVAPHFLPRETRLVGTTITLWEDDDTGYVKEVAYSALLIARPNPGVYSWSTDDQIAGDAAGMRRILRALDAVTAATGGQIAFSPGVGATAVRFEVNPNHPSLGTAAAVAVIRRQGWTNVGVTIPFLSMRVVTSWDSAAHELGHFLGFGHSPDFDLMYRGGAGQLSSVPMEDLFSDHLKRTWRMMAQRPVGQVFPDDDTAVVSGAGGVADTVVVP